jgi:hypothetical protein
LLPAWKYIYISLVLWSRKLLWVGGIMAAEEVNWWWLNYNLLIGFQLVPYASPFSSGANSAHGTLFAF